MLKHTHIRILLSALIVPITFLLWSCKHHDDPTPPAEEPNTRTILVYMVATNNLGTSAFDTSDLREMVQAAETTDLHGGRVIVYHASTKGIVLKEVTAAGIDTLKVYDTSALSVSIERMRQVIDDTKLFAPAKSYGLVLWSHASGWLQDGVDETTDTKLFSYGSDGTVNGKKMNITSLASAISDANFDYIYCDCCYMGSVETVYELRNCAPYIICSPAEIPANGMPYDKNLTYLLDMDTPLADIMKTTAKSTFDTYNDVFQKGDCPNTQAVIRTDKLEALAKATAAVYASAQGLTNPDYSYQRFSRASTCYYFDFRQYVESISTDPALYAAWQQALSDAVIYAEASPYLWSSFAIEEYSGLSTYIMSNSYSHNVQAYNTLQWYNDVASRLLD